MAVRQYVGARYVPKFYQNSQNPLSSEWEGNKAYEALTIVQYNNSSYTSKIPVPAGIGNPAGNPTYWVNTGDYNAQIEQYVNEVTDVKNDITALNNKNNYVTPEEFYNNEDYWDEAFNKMFAEHKPVLLTGTYVLSSSITVPLNVAIIGMNAHINTTDFGLANRTQNALGDNVTDNNRFALVLTGSNTLSGVSFNTKSAGLRIIGDNVKINNCFFMTNNSDTSGYTAYYAIDLKNAQNVEINNVYIYNNATWSDGIHINGNNHNITISNCIIYSKDDPIAFNATEENYGTIEDITVTNCILHGYGIRFYSKNTATKISAITISNCDIHSEVIGSVESSAVRFINDWGVIDDNTYTGQFENIVFANCNIFSESNTQPSVLFNCANAQNVSFTGCNIKDLSLRKHVICSISFNAVNSTKTWDMTGVDSSSNINVTACTLGNINYGSHLRFQFSGSSIYHLIGTSGITDTFMRITGCNLLNTKQELTGDGEYIIIGCRFGGSDTPINNETATFIISDCSAYGNNLLSSVQTAHRVTGNCKIWGASGYPTNPENGDSYFITESNKQKQIIYINGSWNKITTEPI